MRQSISLRELTNISKCPDGQNTLVLSDFLWHSCPNGQYAFDIFYRVLTICVNLQLPIIQMVDHEKLPR